MVAWPEGKGGYVPKIKAFELTPFDSLLAAQVASGHAQARSDLSSTQTSPAGHNEASKQMYET
eukprot:scaffold333685_cov53-Prasinocladus_malaysianus.AAC.1